MSNRSTARVNERGKEVAGGASEAGRRGGRAGRKADVVPPDDLEEYVGPPLHGKTHPPAEMGDATPTLDDEVRGYRHHPNESGAVEFGFDPEAADAAADLAGELGTQFLEGATRGEDLSDRVFVEGDRVDSELPFLIVTDIDQGEFGTSTTPQSTKGDADPEAWEGERPRRARSTPAGRRRKSSAE